MVHLSTDTDGCAAPRTRYSWATCHGERCAHYVMKTKPYTAVRSADSRRVHHPTVIRHARVIRGATICRYHHFSGEERQRKRAPEKERPFPYALICNVLHLSAGRAECTVLFRWAPSSLLSLQYQCCGIDPRWANRIWYVPRSRWRHDVVAYL